MKRLRGICIGAGYFSQFHFDAWRRIPEAQILAVCDLDDEKARRAVELLGEAAPCRAVNAALDQFQPDFVDIITPPATHLALVKEAAHRGIAVICQKPLAPDFATAAEIVALAGRAHLPLMVHENFRFQPWHREIKRLIDSGAIGDRLHNLYFRSRPGDGWGNDAYLARQPYFREMPKLLVHETGVHFIDTFRFLAGEIDEAFAVLRRLNPMIRGEDTGLLTFRFASGATGVWDANRYNESTSDDPRYTFGEFLVEGSGGSIRLYSDGRLTLQPLGEKEHEHPYAHECRGFSGDCVYFTQRHFVERLASGLPFETSGSEYLKTLAVQEAVYESARLNSPVRLSAAYSRATQRDTTAKNRRIVDLSLPIDNNLRGVKITQFTNIAEKGWNSTTLSLYSHCGTHMDAPKHFLGEDAATIDQQSLDVCCGPAKVVDLTPVEPRELLTVERLQRSLLQVEPGDRLLLRTDWSKRFGTDAYRDQLPRISLELAEWLVNKQVALIGVEPPSVADVNDMAELTAVHQTLFRGGVVIVEGLTNLDQLRAPVVEFIALPLRIVAGDGCPVRAIAIEAET
jgi:predicted dehydrogenase/kynurenine formamidase